MKIIKAEQTCWACPSQWDAWTDEGRYVYLRYRHGYGSAVYYDDEITDHGRDVVKEFYYGDSLDGVISLEDFCIQAGIELDLRGE